MDTASPRQSHNEIKHYFSLSKKNTQNSFALIIDVNENPSDTYNFSKANLQIIELNRGLT